MSRTVAIESPRSERVHIGKSRASHHIDVIAAMSFAAFVCVREGGFEWKAEYTPAPRAERRAAWDATGGEPNRAYCTGEEYAEWEDQQAVGQVRSGRCLRRCAGLRPHGPWGRMVGCRCRVRWVPWSRLSKADRDCPQRSLGGRRARRCLSWLARRCVRGVAGRRCRTSPCRVRLAHPRQRQR
jgi:hypothetical protein